MSLSSGPIDATPPAAAAREVPTAGVPTYFVAAPRETEAAAEVVTTGPEARGAATGADVAAAATGAAAAGAAGSPSRAVISASFNGDRLFRLRRACSAAMEDLLHFFPAATCFATSALIPPAAAATGAEGAAGAEATGAAAGGADAAAGAPPAAAEVSQAMGTPALRLAISSSVSHGKPERLRYACSAAITEGLSAALGNTGSRPRTPLAAV